jgi:hypothetical protein
MLSRMAPLAKEPQFGISFLAGGVAEADEENALAAAFAFSAHDGFECVDVASA